MLSLNKTPAQILSKARKVRAIISDVDGVLTDGGIIYNDSGISYKKFNVKDGQIIKYLKKANILTGVITGRDAQAARDRCHELQLDFHFHGVADKAEVLKKILPEYKLDKSEVAYIGDDINDLPILAHCGLSVAPADGHTAVKERVHYITKAYGGHGVLRELADIILYSQGAYESMINTLISDGNF